MIKNSRLHQDTAVLLNGSKSSQAGKKWSSKLDQPKVGIVAGDFGRSGVLMR